MLRGKPMKKRARATACTEDPADLLGTPRALESGATEGTDSAAGGTDSERNGQRNGRNGQRLSRAALAKAAAREAWERAGRPPSEAHHMSVGRWYSVEYFGGGTPGTFRDLQLTSRSGTTSGDGLLTCASPGAPPKNWKTYRVDRVGRVRQLDRGSTAAVAEARPVAEARRLPLRLARGRPLVPARERLAEAAASPGGVPAEPHRADRVGMVRQLDRGSTATDAKAKPVAEVGALPFGLARGRPLVPARVRLAEAAARLGGASAEPSRSAAPTAVGPVTRATARARGEGNGG